MTNILVFSDSGANICLAGITQMREMGLARHDLQHTKRIVGTAGGFKLQSFGWCHILFKLNSTETVQPVHFSQQVNRFYLSKEACIKLHVLPINFPHCNAIVSNDKEAVNVNKVEKIQNRRCTPPERPSKIPFPPVESNVEKLEAYLKDAFTTSTFNLLPPFPAMADTKPAKIHLKPGAEPFAKHVPIPIALHRQDLIKKQLNDDVAKGVIEPVPVGEPIQWCSQMVIVQKKDGSLRRTINYQGLNSQCHRETHHCQAPFLLATQIPANVKKTVFDAVDGYHAIPLHKDSKHLTTFITPWGAYRYCRLPQGFVASADAYTRRYDDLIANFPRKVKCIDDVLLWDKDVETSFFRAWDFLSFCAENGIVLSKKKFKFCQDNIDFAGLRILQDGVAPSNKILQAIEEFPTPSSLTDARSWFGLVNQVAWAHSDSATMAPFRDLIKPNTPFYWDTTLQSSFNESKRHIVDLVKDGVRTFDTSKPTCIQTDWSQQGIGFLLVQKHCQCAVERTINPRCCPTGWKLTYAGSRFTTEAETRYSPTEGEALAVAWSLHKSKFFTLGCRSLTVATDHQPLLGLFKKQMDKIATPRLLRIVSKTLMFTFDIVYTPGAANKGADAVSRNPVEKDTNLLATDDIDEHVEDIPQSMVAILNDEHHSPTDSFHAAYPKLRDAANSDKNYQDLQKLISTGFPSSKHVLSPELQSFWNVKDRLTQTQGGIILMDYRLVIPTNYRSIILKLLHSAHQGVSSMKRRANECVYWPYLNNDLRNIRLNCQYCNEIAPKHTKEPLILTPDPEFPFQQVAADYFSVKGHDYLVLVDRYSGWFTLSYFKPNTATSSNLIDECAALFSSYGAPETFSSDGGPQFTSHEFQEFLKDWSIKHRLSSARYAQSNGRAEAAVKSAKRIISDYVTADKPIDQKLIANAVLQHRNTPLADLNLSPAQILLHRQLRDKLPNHPRHFRLHRQWILTAKQREALLRSKNEAARKTYNRISKGLCPLTPRTPVLLFTGDKNPRWSTSGKVVEILPFRKYKIRLDGSGRIVCRNRRFIREYTPGSISSRRNTIEPISTPVTDAPTIVENDLCDEIEEHTCLPRRLQPFNHPGLSESSQQEIQHRTTRSGREY